MKSIGNSAFASCSKLAEITISDNISYIGDGAFSGCVIARASIPVVAALAVRSGYLQYVAITSGDAIAAESVSGCWQLAQITIANSVTSIGKNAFYDCWQLKKIIFHGTETQWTYISKDAEWKSANCNPTIEYTA